MMTKDFKNPNIVWLDKEDHYCPCNGRCHESRYPCSFSCLSHDNVYGGRKDDNGDINVSL